MLSEAFVSSKTKNNFEMLPSAKGIPSEDSDQDA